MKINSKILISAFVILAAFVLKTAFCQLGEEKDLSILEIKLMNSRQAAEIIEISVKQGDLSIEESYDLISILSESKISGILKSFNDLKLRDFIFYSLAKENLIKSARLITAIETAVSVSMLSRIEEEIRKDIIESIKAISPEYYEKLNAYHDYKFALNHHE